MEHEQVVGYVREQLALGHTEAVLREHLLKHGWSSATVDAVFGRLQSTPADANVKKPRRTHRLRAKRAAKRSRIAIGLAFVLVAAAAAWWLWHPRAETPAVAQAPLVVSYAQKQSADVTTVGGAIGQYAFANGVLPQHLAVGETPNKLIMCNSICDPATSQISMLQVYSAPGVEIVPYAATLSVPDKDTMYLVPNATCESRSKIGRPNTNPRSMIILFAQETDGGLKQYCTVL